MKLLLTVYLVTSITVYPVLIAESSYLGHSILKGLRPAGSMNSSVLSELQLYLML
jgi:hypothetical protein